MRRSTLLLLPLLVFLLSACGAASTTSRTVIVDELSISLEMTAAPRINTAQSFSVTLRDRAGQPLDADEVYLDLTMPAMPMGTNRPIAERQGPGQYLASSAYTMVGEWEITVVARIAGHDHRALFTIEVE